MAVLAIALTASERGRLVVGDVIRMQKPDPEIERLRRASKATVATVMGVSLNTVTAWISRGAPVVERGGADKPYVIDAFELMKWYYTRQKPKPVTPDDWTPKQRLAWYQSETHRKQLEDTCAGLVPVDDARAEMKLFGQALDRGLTKLPQMVRNALGSEASIAVREHIDNFVESARQTVRDKAADAFQD